MHKHSVARLGAPPPGQQALRTRLPLSKADLPTSTKVIVTVRQATQVLRLARWWQIVAPVLATASLVVLIGYPTDDFTKKQRVTLTGVTLVALVVSAEQVTHVAYAILVVHIGALIHAWVPVQYALRYVSPTAFIGLHACRFVAVACSAICCGMSAHPLCEHVRTRVGMPVARDFNSVVLITEIEDGRRS
jgi:hypothetical protein